MGSEDAVMTIKSLVITAVLLLGVMAAVVWFSLGTQ